MKKRREVQLDLLPPLTAAERREAARDALMQSTAADRLELALTVALIDRIDAEFVASLSAPVSKSLTLPECLGSSHVH